MPEFPGDRRDTLGCAWLAATVFALSVFSLDVHATEDITGTFSGTLSGDEQCYPDFQSAPFSVDISIDFTQTNGSFSGSGNFTDDEGSGTVTFEGTIDPESGSVSGSLSGSGGDGEPFSGGFSGSLSGDSLTLNVSAEDDDPQGCIVSVSGTLTRVSGGGLVVNPAETPSSTITNTIVNTIQVQAITNDLSARTSGVLRGRGTGIRRTSTGLMFEGTTGQNAGDGLISGFGLWSSYSYSDFDNDLSSTALDGSRHSILAGIDISPWEAALFGIAIGYEHTDIDTGFNRGNAESDGFTIAPYAGFLLDDLLSVDATLGYTRIDVDQFRTDPASGTRITSGTISDRWFASANMNLFKAYENWVFGARTGFLYLRNSQEDFTESNGSFRPEVINRLSQLQIGGDVAYSLGQFEPFTRLTYEYDVTVTEITVVGGGPQPSHDPDGFLFGLGVRYFGAGGISGNLEWNRRLGRDNFDEDIFMLTVRGEF